MPERSNGYQLPSHPKTLIDRSLWNDTMGDLHARLVAREGLEASFESLMAQGVQASLDYIQANVAPQLVLLQSSIDLAQSQIDQIIIGGKAPDTLKFGGQLPSYYATATALSDGLSGRVPSARKVSGKELSADVTLEKADVGLGNADNTADKDKPLSDDAKDAFGKRVRVDAAQLLSAEQKGRALANIGAIVLSGRRNYRMNGNFEVNQRNLLPLIIPAGGFGYTVDRAFVFNSTDKPLTVSYVSFAAGAREVPGGPNGFLRLSFAAAPTSGACGVGERMDIRTLSGELVTETHFVRAPQASKGANRINQFFGTGGSAAVLQDLVDSTVPIQGGWTKLSGVATVPSVSGKVLGTGGVFMESVWWCEPRAAGNYDVARASLVRGNAVAEDDPGGVYSFDTELDQCQHYFQIGYARIDGQSFQNGYWTVSGNLTCEMRRTPSLSVLAEGGVNCTRRGLVASGGASFELQIDSGTGYFWRYAYINCDAEYY